MAGRRGRRDRRSEALFPLTTASRLDRLRGRRPAWRVLHSVPIGISRGDIDYVLIGPPGVLTINTKHHRTGRLALGGDELVVNGHRTDYIAKALAKPNARQPCWPRHCTRSVTPMSRACFGFGRCWPWSEVGS